MIPEAELRRCAAAAGVDTMVQDLDYGLGWFLAGLFTQTAAPNHLIFKGGTCLRKCYFADYRFSEDLDFTLSRAWRPEALAEAIEKVRIWSLEADGPDFGAAPMRLEMVNDSTAWSRTRPGYITAGRCAGAARRARSSST
jgi:predicted nucleotidyltransferase component of viral defense system